MTSITALASGAAVHDVHWHGLDNASARSWRAGWWGAESHWYLMGSGGNTWRVGR